MPGRALTLAGRGAMLEVMQYRQRALGAAARPRRCQQCPQRACERGLTLVELMAVLVLIGLVVVVGIPNLLRAKVRAELLGQVGMVRQAFAVSRMNAIRAGQSVAMTLETVNGAQAMVAWVDANGNEQREAAERVVGRWTFRSTFSVWEDPSNRFYRLNGTNAGVLYLPNGSALVEQGATTPIGDGAVIVGDIQGNEIRLAIQGGTGTVLQAMKIPGTSDWDSKAMRHWTY